MTRRATSRRRVAGSLALALGATLLAGCGPDADEPAVTVLGEVGAPPVVQFETPLDVTAQEITTLLAGDGPALSDGGPVVLSLTSYDGHTGELLDEQTAGRARVLRLTSADVGADLHRALVGATEGSRLLVTQPVADPETADALEDTDGDATETTDDTGDPDATGSTDEGDEGTAGRMLVIVVDVLRTAATGEPVEAPQNLGVVVGEGEDGAPTLQIDPTAPPAGELQVAQVLRGTGEPVRPGQEVTVQYLGLVWDTGEVYDSTWTPDRGPQVLAVDDTFPGLREALLDQPVGSRVLVVAPPAQAFGTQTIALVVDVLATWGGDPDDVVAAS